MPSKVGRDFFQFFVPETHHVSQNHLNDWSELRIKRMHPLLIAECVDVGDLVLALPFIASYSVQ